MAGQQFIGTARHGNYQNSIAYSGTAGTSAVVSSECYKVYVLVTTDAWVVSDGTAASATNGIYLPALTPIYLTVTPGQKVSAMQVSANGILNIAECL